MKIKIKGDQARISFDYDPELVSLVKKLSQRKFDPSTKEWIFPKQLLPELRGILSNEEEFQEHLELIDQKIKEVGIDEEAKLPVKVTKREDEVEFDFGYIPDILEDVKTIAKFNPDTKGWKTSLHLEKIKQMKSILESVELDITEIDEVIEELQKEKEDIDRQLETKVNEEVSKTKFQFYDHQVGGAKFLLEKKKALLSDEMGGGKTLTSILAMNAVPGKKLVICPASLKLNWKKEIEKTGRQAAVLNGGDDQGTDQAEYIIINYDILDKHLDKLTDFKNIIIDESHYIKNVDNHGKPKAKRAKAVMKITKDTDYVFLLTGTPMPNKTKDIFNQLKVVKHPIADNFFSFAHKYCNATKTRFGWDFDGSSNEEELNTQLEEKMLRRLKSELLDLPDKIRSFLPVTVNTKKYQDKVTEYMQERPRLTDTARNLVHLNALRKILAEEKTKQTIQLIEDMIEQGEKVIIFSCYHYPIETIYQHFEEKAVKLTGETPQSERSQVVEKFQTDNEVKVFVSNIEAGGVGLTLTEASTVIFNDFDWVPLNHVQAEDRAHRIGQDHKVNVYYIYADNAIIDKKLSDLIEVKAEKANEIVDGGKGDVLKAVIKELNPGANLKKSS